MRPQMDRQFGSLVPSLEEAMQSEPRSQGGRRLQSSLRSQREALLPGTSRLRCSSEIMPRLLQSFTGFDVGILDLNLERQVPQCMAYGLILDNSVCLCLLHCLAWLAPHGGPRSHGKPKMDILQASGLLTHGRLCPTTVDYSDR